MTNTERRCEKGNVLFYVLICVAIVGALSYVITRGSGDTGSGMAANKIAEEIRTQAQTIRSALLECNLVNNMGYPAQPGTGLAADLQCPRQDGSFENIFTGTSNRFMPPSPPPFTGGWRYTATGGPPPTTITISLTQATNCTANRGLQSAFTILTGMFTTEELATVCNGTTATVTIYIIKP